MAKFSLVSEILILVSNGHIYFLELALSWLDHTSRLDIDMPTRVSSTFSPFVSGAEAMQAEMFF